MTICLRCVVSGNVQGVFFRATTQRRAQQLGVNGWVRNCVDGSVELLACGDESQVRVLEAWLWQGSPQSDVSDVVVEAVELQQHSGFEIV